MRKMTFIVSLFVSLMLTPLAMAQGWKSNEVTNRTTRNVYLVFSTWRPATQSLPEGYRITGHYLLKPNQTHEFHAFNNNAFYLQVWHPNLKVIKPTANTRTFSAPVIGDPFEMVLQRQISFAFRTNTILYRRPSGNYPLEDGFLRYGNTGTPINITSTWVNIDVPPLPPVPPETGKRGGKETVEEVPVAPEVPEPAIIPTSLTISGDLSIVAGETGTITATVRSPNGAALPGVLVRFSENSERISLSRTNGTTDNSGNISTTVTAISQGGAVLSVAVDGYPALSRNEAITVVETPPGSLTVSSFSTSINEGDSRTITAIIRSASGNPLAGKTVRFQESSSAISFSSVNGTTNSSGQVSTTLRSSHVSSRSVSATFYVRVDGYSGLDRSFNVTVRQVPSKLLVSPQILSDITSGRPRTITATVRSKGNYVMSGITVEFVESDYEIKFSRTRGVTNSSGQVTSTLRTGHYGSASFVVKAGSLSKRYNLTVSRFTKPFNLERAAFSRKLVCDGPWENWTIIANVPGDVIGTYHIKYKIPEDDLCCMEYQGMRLEDSDTIRVSGRARTHCRNQNEIYVTLTGNYAAYASPPGAPSLQPQLRPETDHLSVVWEDLSQVPSESALLPNYPNPFNPETWIPYHLAESAEVTLTIYSADGRLVRMLALGHQPAGIYENKSRAAYWDGRNAVGERVASGLYFYTLTAADFAATGKMLIMK